MLALEHARQHLSRGQWALARPLLERAVRSDPKDPDAAFLFARTLQMLGEPEPAAYHAARCVELRPKDPNTRIAAAELLQALGKPADAERLLRAGVRDFPAVSTMHAGLINALRAQGRLGDAGDAALDAASRFERDPLLAIIAAGALGESLRGNFALELIRRAVTLAPQDHRILRAAATMLLYCDDAADSNLEVELAALHAAAGRSIAAATPESPLTPHAPSGPLRVGLVSPDFRDHAVARFLESWIGQHDRDRLRLFGIATLGPEDDTTARLRSQCDEWLDVSKLHDDAAANAIRNLRLDAAIDCAGLHVTARPALFARRLATLQVNWLGYAHPTGLPTIDARLSDAIADPSAQPVKSVAQHAARDPNAALEPIVALEGCFLCFKPDPRTPEIASRYSGQSHVRFASFNAQQKISPTTLDLWCRVLHAVPDSTLVLKSRALADASLRRVLDAALQARGIAPFRVESLPHAPNYVQHLSTYNTCDIALDTTPYAGTTTTCEAMLMGLPVITLSGNRHAARVGASLLTAAGCPEHIAADADSFVRLAQRAADECRASDTAARQQAKVARRAALLASPLCDGRAFATRLQQALLALTRDSR